MLPNFMMGQEHCGFLSKAENGTNKFLNGSHYLCKSILPNSKKKSISLFENMRRENMGQLRTVVILAFSLWQTLHFKSSKAHLLPRQNSKSFSKNLQLPLKKSQNKRLIYLKSCRKELKPLFITLLFYFHEFNTHVLNKYVWTVHGNFIRE